MRFLLEKEVIGSLPHVRIGVDIVGREITIVAVEEDSETKETTVIDDPIIDYGDRKTLRFVCEKCNREIGGMPPYEKFKTFCPSCKNFAWFNPKKKEE